MNTGTLVTIVEKQKFDFTYLPVSTSENIILAKAINVIPYYYASVWVRIHTNRTGAGTSAKVVAYAVNPSKNDQQRYVLDGSPTFDTNSFHSVTAPELVVAYASDLPPFLEIQLQVSQNTSAATNIFFEISVDLLLRTA